MNGDLVEKVARVLWGNASFGGAFEDVDVDDKDALRSEASAVIATVLDDMEARLDDGYEYTDPGDAYALIASARRELGLSSPEKPGDARKPASGTQQPKEV